MIDPKVIYAGVVARDPDAEAELVAFLRGLVFRDYERTLGTLAEDYSQELALRVIEAIRAGKINDPEKLIPYCQDFAKNVRIDGLRIAMRQARKLVAINEARYLQTRENTETDAIRAEFTRTVLRLMERLDPFSREIVRRYYYEQQTLDEIARELGRTRLECQRLKDRAVEKLRRDYRVLVNAQGWELLRGKKSEREMDRMLLPVAA